MNSDLPSFEIEIKQVNAQGRKLKGEWKVEYEAPNTTSWLVGSDVWVPPAGGTIGVIYNTLSPIPTTAPDPPRSYTEYVFTPVCTMTQEECDDGDPTENDCPVHGHK